MNTSQDNGGAYTDRGVQWDAPAQPGVYMIFKMPEYQGEPRVIYIGRAKSLRQRLLQHVRGESDQAACINQYKPEVFTFDLIPDESQQMFRENALIAYYDPPCNNP